MTWRRRSAPLAAQAVLAVSLAGLPAVSLAGCSDRDGGSTTAPSAAASSSGIGIPVAPEALEPGPSIRAGDDARALLRPGADVERLAVTLSAELDRLHTVHVVESVRGDRPATASYDVDAAEGRCSGELDGAGLRGRFVTTPDGTLLVTTDEGSLGQRLAGRWVQAPVRDLAEYCTGGPLGVVTRSADGSGRDWLLHGARRIGSQRLDGRQVVHFRTTAGEAVADSYLGADDGTVRLEQVVIRSADGSVTTLRLSAFDSAGPVSPVPPEDSIVPASALDRT